MKAGAISCLQTMSHNGCAFEASDSSPGDRASLSQAAGHLFGKIGVLVLVVILLLAAWHGQLAIAVLAAVVLSATGLARVWSRAALARVEYQRSLSESRVFPGEYIKLTLRVNNRKPLPLPWLEVCDELPIGSLSGKNSLKPGVRAAPGYLSNMASLFWYRGISWRYRLHCLRRGYYSLGPVSLSSGDIFGFYPRSKVVNRVDHVIVYPKLFSLTELGLPSQQPLGEAKATQRIFEDPTRTIGIREYTPNDPLKYIHWKASARHQQLQTKVFEPTTTLQVILFLGIDSFENNWQASGDDAFELAVSTVASLADHLIRRRNPVGLFVNTRLVTSGQPVRMLPSSRLDQLLNILEALAKTLPLSSGSFEEFLSAKRRDLPLGATLVFVVFQPSESLLALLASLREAGHNVVLLRMGEQPGDWGSYGATCYDIKRPGEPQATSESQSSSAMVLEEIE